MPKRVKPRGHKSPISRMGELSWTAVEIAGGWAETSERLSNGERDELVRLRKRRTPLTKAERAKYASLVAKAVGAERLRARFPRLPPPTPEPPTEVRDVGAAERLKAAAQLRDLGVITEEDFLELKNRYLNEL